MGKRDKHASSSSDSSSSESSGSDSDDSRKEPHKKHHRHHDKSSKSSDKHSSSSDKRKKEEKQKHREEKQKSREKKKLTKLLETPEEKKRRRLEKKQKKHSKDAPDSKELFGYTNDANPFGDANLLTPFKWKKKNEVLAKKYGVSEEDIVKEQDKRRRDDLKSEIEKLKRRREEREEEKRKWEEERSRLAREAEGMNGLDWDRKEEEFHLQQAKLRSQIRLKQARAKPIDILAKNLELSDEFDVEMNEPYKIFRGLQLFELQELKRDIKGRLDLGQNTEFWSALMVVCEDEIQTNVAAQQPQSPGRIGRTGVHHAIESDVVQSLSLKTHSQLTALQENILKKLQEDGVDPEYWESLLRQVNIQKAKARLRDMHADMLRTRLTSLQQRHLKQAKETRERDLLLADETEAALNRSDALRVDSSANSPLHVPGLSEGVDHSHMASSSSSAAAVVVAHNQNQQQLSEPLSPLLMSALGPEDIAISASDDEQDIRTQRHAVIQAEAKRKTELETHGTDSGLSMMREEARRGMEVGDSAFNIEVPVSANQVYWWHDKYRPRKPRFFNRVNTGYEWNKYNQTHYDHDNPPPKTVQGYKFNIFFPDLIDPTKTPTFVIEEGDNPDTCVIRFHAGPPYEDIAFKIVNKEWQYSRKSGYKCTFQRGVLHLYFNFKRYRYRR